SVTVAWVALNDSPPDASSKTCEGYVLEASSNNFGALAPTGAPVFTSSTFDNGVSTLTVGDATTPLDLSPTYYFRVSSLNWNGLRNTTQFTRLVYQISQSTGLIHLGAIDPFVARSTVSTSSMVVTNLGNWPVTIELSADVTSGPWTLAASSDVDVA